MDNDDAKPLVAAYAAFLCRYKWDWWCHLTFAKAPSRTRAFASVNAWLNGLNRKVFGKNYANRGQGIRWVRGTEFQKLGAYHFHMLLSGCQDIHTNVGVASWRKLAGDAKIMLYEQNRGAEQYIAKVYRVNSALDFGGSWTPLDLSEISQLSAMR